MRISRPATALAAGLLAVTLTACGASEDSEVTTTAESSTTVASASTAETTSTAATSTSPTTSAAHSPGELVEVDGLRIFIPEGFEEDTTFTGMGPYSSLYDFTTEAGLKTSRILISGVLPGYDSAEALQLDMIDVNPNLFDDYREFVHRSTTDSTGTYEFIRIEFGFMDGQADGYTYILQEDGRVSVTTVVVNAGYASDLVGEVRDSLEYVD